MVVLTEIGLSENSKTFQKELQLYDPQIYNYNCNYYNIYYLLFIGIRPLRKLKRIMYQIRI